MIESLMYCRYFYFIFLLVSCSLHCMQQNSSTGNIESLYNLCINYLAKLAYLTELDQENKILFLNNIKQLAGQPAKDLSKTIATIHHLEELEAPYCAYQLPCKYYYDYQPN